MSAAPDLGIPELAGQCTYGEAARDGLSVDENVRRLLRYHWVTRRTFEAGIAHLPATPEWEVKCALALHQYQDIEQVDALQRRIAEMRNPMPRLDTAPDGELDAFMEEALRAVGVTAKIQQPACFRKGAEACRFVITSPMNDVRWTG